MALETYGEYLENLKNGLRHDQAIERDCINQLITFALQGWEWDLCEVVTWLQNKMSRLSNDREDKARRSICEIMLHAAQFGWENEPIYAWVPPVTPERRPTIRKPTPSIDYEGQSKRLLNHRVRMIKADRANRRIYERNRRAMY